VTLAGISGALSCRQIVGVPDDPGTSACGLPWGTTDCASCASANCCAESNACEGEVPCAGYYQCVGACKVGDWQCRSKCGTDHPFGDALHWPALQACMAGKCESQCGLTCGGIGAAGFSPPGMAATCQACFEGNTCSSALSCFQSVGCAGWIQCINACSTPDCRLTCGIRYGYADAGSVLQPPPHGPPEVLSLANACTVACGVGANWSCVGKVRWPGATTASTTLSTQVRDLASGNPVPGADVSLCTFRDPDCTNPIVPRQKTDASGNIAFTVPFSAFGFASPADSYTQVIAPGYVPALYFIGYGVSEPVAPLAQPDVIIAMAAGASQFSWDQTLGWVQAGVFDCDGAPAPGVQITIDSTDLRIRQYYYQTGGGTWVPDFKGTATGSFPYGGFMNVPPGIVTLTATPLGQKKPSAQVHVLVRAGTLSNYFMFPTP
jgi:hypothetical protein